MISNKKSSILLVLNTLKEYTDEEHFLTQQEIVEKIYQNYDFEIERKSVGSSIQLLIELDYDIVKGPRGGFALFSRTFDLTEATFLVDAVLSSKSIDGKMAKKLCDCICSCFSKYQRKDYSYIYKSSKINRTNNVNILYNISIIQEAIKKGKRIGFQYMTYDDNGTLVKKRNGFQYIVSPYYLINNFGRYYLLCNYREKYRALQIFKLEYISNIEIKNNWPIKSLTELKNAPKNFSITEFINDHIYMLDGDTIEVEIELDESSCIQYVKEWFGNNSKLKKIENKIHVIIKSNENALYYWVMQYSDCIKVISPKIFVDRVRKGLKEALDRYE